MVSEGCLKNPDVDYVIGLHVQSYLEAGKIELKYGKLNAPTHELKIHVYGKYGHGAYPDSSIEEITNNIVNAYGENCLIQVKEGYKFLVNDDKIVDIIYNVAKQAKGEANIQFKDMPSMGGEDFSYFMDNVKGAFYHLCIVIALMLMSIVLKQVF